MSGQERRSPLHDEHLKLKARMVPFAGWEMPVQYAGIMPENKAVRSNLGVFDISHMGQFRVSSQNDAVAQQWLDSLLTNNVAKLNDGDGQYTMLLNEAGGVIDDLIVYRMAANDYFLVVNAARIGEDYAWMSERLIDGIKLTNDSDTFAAMALQGPKTVEACHQLFPDCSTLPERFCVATISTHIGDVIVCRTGYTGEDGIELFCPIGNGPEWWNRCLEAGADPCGLGSRDSLRLEKCYPLNGSDLDSDHTPLQAGLGFAVDLGKEEFIGKAVLDDQKANGMPTRLVALKQTGKCPPPRPGYDVYSGDEKVGTLCSGGMSPTLSCGISMAYVTTGQHKIGTVLDVEIRGKRYPAEIIKKPFV